MLYFFLIFSCVGMIAGLTAGYVYSKKTTQTIKFVSSSQKNLVLEKNHIMIDETSKCAVCDEKISLENIGAILHTESGDTFICSKKSCLTLSKIVS